MTLISLPPCICLCQKAIPIAYKWCKQIAIIGCWLCLPLSGQEILDYYKEKVHHSMPGNLCIAPVFPPTPLSPLSFSLHLFDLETDVSDSEQMAYQARNRGFDLNKLGAAAASRRRRLYRADDNNHWWLAVSQRRGTSFVAERSQRWYNS